MLTLIKNTSLHSATSASTYPTNEEDTPNNNSEWIWILALTVVSVLCACIGIVKYRIRSRVIYTKY